MVKRGVGMLDLNSWKKAVLALENKLIDDVETWMGYHYARNRTSHTYNRVIAEDVYEII